MSFDLLDGVEKNRAHPTTFNIPSATQKAMLGPGDFVKFGFVLPQPKASVTVERMWVEVTSIVGEVIVGTLANEPSFLDGLKFGDIVRGELRNVIGVHQARRRTLQ